MLLILKTPQVSAIADEPAGCAASLQTCCKQRWTLSVINLPLNSDDNACDGRRFQVICRKLPILTYPTCIWHPHCGWPHLSFAEIFGIRKRETLGYCVVLFAWSYV